MGARRRPRVRRVPARGADDLAERSWRYWGGRDPVATLAGVLDTNDTAAPRSAVATATESATEAGSARTAAELFTDAAQLAATERTAGSLDQLAADGVITDHERARVAAEDGTATLARILRRAELAGHDPRQVLHDAVANRPLNGVRSVTNVVHGRVRDAHTFDPVGSTWADWTPRTDSPEWAEYLASLADAVDQRAEALGAELADTAPRWLTTALGPVPDAPEERDAWQDRAAAIGAWRELRGHDDPEDVLGPAPAPGEVEAYAGYRAAWTALGRPDIDREELELSDGQLRVRVRAYEREAAWAPRYVGNELAGTHQAAAHARQNEQLRRAEAAASPDDERARLAAQAAEAAALAATLDRRAGQLQELDDARARWLLHTAGTRAASERSKVELAARHIDDTAPEPLVTAEEWLAAHREAVIEDERHREVTEADVEPITVEATAEHDGAAQTVEPAERDAVEPAEVDDIEPPDEQTDADEEAPAPVVEPEPAEASEPDLRDVAVTEPGPVAEDDVRVPTAEETAEATRRANRALTEMRAREAADAEQAAAHRAEELARWQADDQAEQVASTVDSDDLADEPF